MWCCYWGLNDPFRCMPLLTIKWFLYDLDLGPINPKINGFPGLMFRKFLYRHRSTLLCLNFVKFVRREIGEIVRYLPDQKNKQNFACLSNCRYCSDRDQNLPVPAPNNVLRVFQISSKSVHFRRSYSRTREHRQIAPKSKSNIRPKPIFEPNN